MSDPIAAAHTVDAETMSLAERPSTLLSLFDSLPPGESFVFSSRESPEWLLETLRAQRRGQFDWTPLESGRTGFRVEISRRGAERGSLRRVSSALGWDHERLARLEVGAFVARTAGDTDTASAWYESFSFGLRRHIAIEEQFLFPLFEERSGIAPRRNEHGIGAVAFEGRGDALSGDGRGAHSRRGRRPGFQDPGFHGLSGTASS